MASFTERLTPKMISIPNCVRRTVASSVSRMVKPFALRTPCTYNTKTVVFTPMTFIEWPARLVSKPHVNRAEIKAMFLPNKQLRQSIFLTNRSRSQKTAARNNRPKIHIIVKLNTSKAFSCGSRSARVRSRATLRYGGRILKRRIQGGGSSCDTDCLFIEKVGPPKYLLLNSTYGSQSVGASDLIAKRLLFASLQPKC